MSHRNDPYHSFRTCISRLTFAPATASDAPTRSLRTNSPQGLFVGCVNERTVFGPFLPIKKMSYELAMCAWPPYRTRMRCCHSGWIGTTQPLTPSLAKPSMKRAKLILPICQTGSADRCWSGESGIAVESTQENYGMMKSTTEREEASSWMSFGCGESKKKWQTIRGVREILENFWDVNALSLRQGVIGHKFHRWRWGLYTVIMFVILKRCKNVVSTDKEIGKRNSDAANTEEYGLWLDERTSSVPGLKKWVSASSSPKETGCNTVCSVNGYRSSIRPDNILRSVAWMLRCERKDHTENGQLIEISQR